MVGCRQKQWQPVQHKSAAMSKFFSIGVIDTPDTAIQKGVTDFFASHEILALVEGTVMFDVRVQKEDLQRVKELLRTNGPPYRNFHSAWEKAWFPP